MDQNLLELINLKWTDPQLDLFMAIMSSFDVWMLMLALIALLVLIAGSFRARTMVICGVIIVAFAESVVVKTMKAIVERPRPHELLANVRQVSLDKSQFGFLALRKPVEVKMSRPRSGLVSGRSFPSGHTVNNFCAAIVLILFYPRWGWLYLLPASSVAYSRIYVGSHWPSDIVASILLAIGVTLLLLALFELLWRRLARTVAPGLYRDHPTLVRAA